MPGLGILPRTNCDIQECDTSALLEICSQSPFRSISALRTSKSSSFSMYVFIAKFCCTRKQHFANPLPQTFQMSEKSINDVLAENLAHFMTKRAMSREVLAKKSGVSLSVIGYYLGTKDRQSSKSGKEPGATLARVGRLAGAMGIHTWQLLTPNASLTDAQAIGQRILSLRIKRQEKMLDLLDDQEGLDRAERDAEKIIPPSQPQKSSAPHNGSQLDNSV